MRACGMLRPSALWRLARLPRTQTRASLRRQRINSQTNSATMRPQSTVPSYPGLGLDLRTSFDNSSHYPMAAQPNSSDHKSQVLPVRELAMMNVMDKLTDKPDWHKKIFDDTIVTKWRKEALAIPNDQFWKELVDHDWYTSDIVIPDDLMDSEVLDYVCVLSI